jgi:hypothetical protein
VRRRARAVAALLILPILSLPNLTGASARQPEPATGASPEIELVAQTPVVEPGGTFAMRLRLIDVPDDGSVRVIVHQRVRSRSELAQSMDGDGLRSEVFNTAYAISELPRQPDGSRRLAISLDAANGGLPLSAEGVYPVEVIAQDATAAPVASLVTHLITGPGEGDDAPPLGVAVVAQVGAPPALQPDGAVVLPPGDVADMAGVVAGLAAAPDVPVNVAARPETIDALLASAAASDVELVNALRASVQGRTVLALPYVEVSPDSLEPAGLLDQLGLQMTRGVAVLSDELGVTPVGTVAMSPPSLGRDGLAALSFFGATRVVVASDQVVPLDPSPISYSLAQPFVLSAPEDSAAPDETSTSLEALATDPIVVERLATEGSPGLVTSRVLAELALLRLEQPSVARSVVLPLEASTPAGVVQLLLEGLGEGRPFEPMTLAGAFDHAAPLLDAGGNVVDRPLAPSTPQRIRPSEGAAIQEARADLDTFTGLVGAESPTLEPLDHHLLVSMAYGLSDERRQGHVDTVESTIDTVSGQVVAPETFTLTLAARDGTIPLTLGNASGMPLQVSIRLRSQKLEFPEGDSISLLLTEPSTRIDIPVRARTSGAFPLQIDVLTPDGERRLAMSRYTVRSTAVSGVGLVLSIGAGAFLVLWWARHWHRTRRSARLVAANAHPAAGAGK